MHAADARSRCRLRRLSLLRGRLHRDRKPQFKADRHHRRRLRPGLPADRPQRPAAQPGRLQGQGGGVFFGYTQCPDVCPTTMAELAEAKKLLGPDGDKVQGVFVTVDPERDTPEVLKAYMANFDPSFLALRGTPEQTGRDRQGLQGLLQEGGGQDARQLHHGPLRRQPTSSTRKAGCACTRATAPAAGPGLGPATAAQASLKRQACRRCRREVALEIERTDELAGVGPHRIHAIDQPLHGARRFQVLVAAAARPRYGT